MAAEKKLAYTVHVRRLEPIDPKRPEHGSTVAQEQLFLAGETLPAWARPHVGDHVYEQTDDTPDEVAPNGAADPDKS